MKITPINFYNQNNALGFKRSNLKQVKPQVLPNDLYFIRMGAYYIDHDWANKMNNATYVISDMIRNNADFEDIWKETANQLLRINIKKYPSYCEIRNGKSGYCISPYGGRGYEYYKKYKHKIEKAGGEFEPKGNEEYPYPPKCRIDGKGSVFISYGSEVYYDYLKLKAYVKNVYDKLKSTKNPSDGEINRSVATIHWLIAQASPFRKGSDSFANLFTKSIYHAYNMKLTPAKSGVSFDFEAFYSDLDDYIKKYPKLFEKPPSRA